MLQQALPVRLVCGFPPPSFRKEAAPFLLVAICFLDTKAPLIATTLHMKQGLRHLGLDISSPRDCSATANAVAVVGQNSGPRNTHPPKKSTEIAVAVVILPKKTS